MEGRLVRVITSFDPWNSPLCTCPDKNSVSAYTGCSYKCTYCYITSYIPHAFNCRAKKNFLNRLRNGMKYTDPSKPISMANSSDPYPPVEEDLKLTRRALKMLLESGFMVLIITKSPLVTRDVDVIIEGNCSVSMSISTLNDKIAKRLEPGAPPPTKRVDAIRRLVRSGVPCSVRVDPLIPGINNEGVEELVKTMADSGVRHVVASTYKAKKDSFARVVEAFPEAEERLTKLYWSIGKQIGRSRYLPREMRYEILLGLKKLVEERGLTYATCREGMLNLQSGKTCDGSHLIQKKERVK